MAGNTGLVQAHEGLRPGTQLPVLDVLGSMALTTIHGLMSTRERITGERMIEGLLIETHHLELPSMVFAVAARAILPSHILAGMVALLSRDERTQFLVALKALGVRHLVPQVVALRAIAHPFQ